MSDRRVNQDKIYLEIIECFSNCGSVKETAEKLGTYPIKVRKVLITEGLWSSRTSRAVGELNDRGYTVKQIAKELCLSEKNVQSYMPYSRGGYGGDNRSSDAIRSEGYRKRMLRAANNQVLEQLVGRKRGCNMKKERLSVGVNRPYAMKLRLDLDLSDLSVKEMNVLRKYGKVDKGISREIVIPGDMTLHALHYAINKAFGWQNSHLHSFHVGEDDFERMTDGDQLMTWTKLAGMYFRFPSDDYEDIYWDDDYNEGISFKSWLKSKYKGPYYYGGQGEYFDSCQREVRELLERCSMLEVNKPFGVWYEECKALREATGDSEAVVNKIEKVIPIEQARVSELMNSIMFESGFDALLERIAVADLLVKVDEEVDWAGWDFARRWISKVCEGNPDITTPEVMPVLTSMRYWYDYGDDWNVRITCSEVWESEGDFIKGGYDSMLINKLLPFCVESDGLCVVDDVGGVSGYCRMLDALHGEDEEEKVGFRTWARGMGWTGRMSKVENVL